jgi:hypothetical protein
MNCRKNLPWRSVALLLLGLTWEPTPLIAQSFSINWYTIDGGGGTSTSEVYSVSGTIGQPDANTLTGGPYTLVGGFWSIVAAIQTPGAPFLSISQDATSSDITVSWPRPATGYLLQETTVLTGSTVPWADVAFPYRTNQTDIFIAVPNPAGNKFYRLRKP